MVDSAGAADPGGRQFGQTTPPEGIENARWGPTAPQRAQSSNEGDQPAMDSDLSR